MQVKLDSGNFLEPSNKRMQVKVEKHLPEEIWM